MLRELECALQKFCAMSLHPAQSLGLTGRFNAQRGDLIISFFGNLIRQGELIEAKAELIE
jgi:hypothetical protein